jgi:hypothetical protein
MICKIFERYCRSIIINVASIIYEQQVLLFNISSKSLTSLKTCAKEIV